jgi:hypothetical protein
MSNELTHWRKGFNPDYLGAYSLAPDYRDIILTIDYVRQDVEVIDQNGKKSPCMVAYFTENVKPMILNVTNSKVLVKLSGSEFIQKWSGLKVQIFVAKVKVAREQVDALRIRPFAPQTELPELLPNTETWANAVTHMVSNGFTIDQVEKKYKLSPDSKVQLLKDVSEKIAETSENGESENV